MVRVSGSRARAGRRGSAIGLLNSEDDTAYAANAQKYGNADRGSYMERVRQTMETMQERIEDFSSMQIPPATATAAATAAATTTTTAFNNILIGGTKTNDDAPAEPGWATMQDDSFGDMSFNNKNNDHGEFGVSAFDFPESTTAAKEFDDHHNDDGFGPVFVAPNSAKEEDDDDEESFQGPVFKAPASVTMNLPPLQRGSRARANRRGSAIGLLNNDDVVHDTKAQKYNTGGSILGRMQQTMESMQQKTIENLQSVTMRRSSDNGSGGAPRATGDRPTLFRKGSFNLRRSDHGGLAKPTGHIQTTAHSNMEETWASIDEDETVHSFGEEGHDEGLKNGGGRENDKPKSCFALFDFGKGDFQVNKGGKANEKSPTGDFAQLEFSDSGKIKVDDKNDNDNGFAQLGISSNDPASKTETNNSAAQDGISPPSKRGSHHENSKRGVSRTKSLLRHSSGSSRPRSRSKEKRTNSSRSRSVPKKARSFHGRASYKRGSEDNKTEEPLSLNHQTVASSSVIKSESSSSRGRRQSSSRHSRSRSHSQKRKPSRRLLVPPATKDGAADEHATSRRSSSRRLSGGAVGNEDRQPKSMSRLSSKSPSVSSSFRKSADNEGSSPSSSHEKSRSSTGNLRGSRTEKSNSARTNSRVSSSSKQNMEGEDHSIPRSFRGGIPRTSSSSRQVRRSGSSRKERDVSSRVSALRESEVKRSQSFRTARKVPDRAKSNSFRVEKKPQEIDPQFVPAAA